MSIHSDNGPQIYLDHNATTPVLPEIWAAAAPFLTRHFGNPSSRHWAGHAPQRALQVARKQVSDLLGAEPEQIVFTSGGTESNQLAILGVLNHRPAGRLLISNIEHPSVRAPAQRLAENGWSIEEIPVDADGRLCTAAFQAACREPVTAVSILLANNETGVIQPVQEISDWVKPQQTLVHTDAAQAVGKIPVDVITLGVDFLSVAGHKLYAPKGIGALYVKDPSTLHPLFHGGGQEGGLRPGTQNIVYIVALGAACALAKRDLQAELRRQGGLRKSLFDRIQRGVSGLVRHGTPEQGLPNTLSLRFPNCHGADLLDRCPNLAASTGSACHASDRKASSVILAMGIDPIEAQGTVRLSLGRNTTQEQINSAAEQLISAWRHLCRPPL